MVGRLNCQFRRYYKPNKKKRATLDGFFYWEWKRAFWAAVQYRLGVHGITAQLTDVAELADFRLPPTRNCEIIAEQILERNLTREMMLDGTMEPTRSESALKQKNPLTKALTRAELLARAKMWRERNQRVKAAYDELKAALAEVDAHTPSLDAQRKSID